MTKHARDRRPKRRWHVVVLLLLVMSAFVWTVHGRTVVVDVIGLVDRNGGDVQRRAGVDLLDAPFDSKLTSQTQAQQAVLFKTAPADLPQFIVTPGEGETGDGFIFMAYFNYWRLEQPAYLLILENDGQPIYFNRLEQEAIAIDFKKQPNGLLTYFPLLTRGKFVALDATYSQVGSFGAGNGYPTDLHDLQILPNGNALLLVYDRRTIDMSQVIEGGHSEAEVTGCIIQEIDNAGAVLFQWRSWDHIPITDSNQPLTDERVSYIHCNSVELDRDGNILISSRHLDEITKISRQTGEIMWRLGGKANQFVDFAREIRFNYPHDVRRLANGHITVFDNGVAHSPQISRGLEYQLDETNRTVRLVREIRNVPDSFSDAMGNMQRLPNGNTLIGWGRSIDVPVFSEFDSAGQKVLEFDGLPGYGSYRVFRFPWRGYPTWPPALLAEAHKNSAKLYFSWNGSTETVTYKVLGGRARDRLVHLGTAAKQGFESSFTLDALDDGLWYFQVLPVDGNGAVGQPSKLAPLVIGREPLFLPVIIH